LTDPACLVLVE